MKESSYSFANYINYREHEKSIILRHDVDFDLKKAACMARIEQQVLKEKSSAVYFVLVSTNFYNIFSKESKSYLKDIVEHGGEIGLHFDETQYDINTEEELKEYIKKERDILQILTGKEVNVVSMHRPSKKFLSSELQVENMINAYGNKFFKEMKYISDSRRNWKEDVEKLISEEKYERLQVLTHPVWYTKVQKKNIREAVKDEIIGAMEDKYINFKNNISDFDSVMAYKEFEILYARAKGE